MLVLSIKGVHNLRHLGGRACIKYFPQYQNQSGSNFSGNRSGFGATQETPLGTQVLFMYMSERRLQLSRFSEHLQVPGFHWGRRVKSFGANWALHIGWVILITVSLPTPTNQYIKWYPGSKVGSILICSALKAFLRHCFALLQMNYLKIQEEQYHTRGTTSCFLSDQLGYNRLYLQCGSAGRDTTILEEYTTWQM